MNVQTVMRMAASGEADPADWTQVRLSQMDTVLPWQDPDGAFVSLVEDATTGWVITLEYNGAGGTNDGFAEGVAWKSASLGAVVPGRAATPLVTLLHYPEFAALIPAIPADSAAWQPWVGCGILYDNSSSNTVGCGVSCNTAASASAVAVVNTGRTGGAIVGTTRGAIGSTWTTSFTGGLLVACATNAARTAAGGFSSAGAAGSQAYRSTATAMAAPAVSGYIVCFGNAVLNPAAGNRTITVKHWVRLFDLGINSWDPSVDATGWTVISPADFGDPAIPTSDPNAFLSAFDATGLPEWRPTLDDNGDAVVWDGLTEGTRWQAALPAGWPQATAPVLLATKVTQFAAYAGTQQFGIGTGVWFTGTTIGEACGPLGAAGPNLGAQGIAATANTTLGASSAFPGTCDGSAALIVPYGDGTVMRLGKTIASRQLAGSVFGGFRDDEQLNNTADYPGDGPTFVVAANKDSAILGTASTELRFSLWWATPPDYVLSIPTNW